MKRSKQIHRIYSKECSCGVCERGECVLTSYLVTMTRPCVYKNEKNYYSDSTKMKVTYNNLLLLIKIL